MAAEVDAPMLKATQVRDGVVRTLRVPNRIPEPEPATGPKLAEGGSSALTPAHLDGKLVCRLAIDIGGTFTDAVLEEDSSHVATRIAVKVLTTPRSPAEGLLGAALRALDAGGRRPEQVRMILHGTTLATNAVLERRGARTAILTTEGFRDVLEVGSGGRHDLFDLKMEKTRPLVPRRLRFTIRQRHRADGAELEPLDEGGLHQVARKMRAAGVESVAICFLHSYANRTHEERAATILRTSIPGLHLCTSSAVSPEIREYERFSTAAVNAYVQPLMSQYLRDAQAKLDAAGFKCPLLLMTSGGGLTDADTAAKLPVRLVESGPAGGVMLAENVAREVGADDVLSLDMGGTTAKVCMLTKGRAVVAREFEVDRAERFRKYSGLPVRIPCLDLVEICGGGGSIASTSSIGAVTVGPTSAGADPGPACYGRGGTAATVTDADVVLGRMDPADFAAGEVQLKPDEARSALRAAITDPQGLGCDELAAQAVADVVEEAMAGAAKAHAAEHGRDLGQTALVAFGGAAPLHAARLAERLGLGKVVIPVDASVGSAIGFLSAPLAFEAVRSRPMRLDDTFNPKEVNSIYQQLWHETVMVVAAGAARWKPGRPAKERRRAYGRYCGQGQEVAVELPIRDLNAQDVVLLRDRFEEAYKQLHSRTIPGAPVEILTWAQEVVADADPLVWAKERLRAEKRSVSAVCCNEELPAKRPRPASMRPLFDGSLGRATDVPVYLRKELPFGACVLGPAIIAERYTSTVVTQRFQCEVLENGFLQLAIAKPLASCAPETCTETISEQPDVQVPVTVGTLGNIAAQLIWKRLLANVEEQARLLIRAAFSPVVREAHALACGVFDSEGRLLALSNSGTPGLTGALVGAVTRFLRHCAPADLEDGDTLISNDPWIGTGHLCDFTAVTPVFASGTAIGFVASSSHTTDIGGSASCLPDDADAHAAGFCLPVSKLVRCGTINMDLVYLLRTNSKCPDYCVGDVLALVACNELGVKRLNETLAEFATTDLLKISEYVRDASRHALLRRLAEVVPLSGAWEHWLEVDDGSGELGNSMRLESCVKVSDAGIRVDLQTSKLPSCLTPALCVPFLCTEAYVRYALCSILAHDIPLNDGSLTCLKVSAPSASPLSTEHPKAVNGRRMVGHFLPDLVFGCLAQALPEGSLPAEGASAICRLDFQRVLGSEGGLDAPAVAVHVESGGTGARVGSDGLSATAFPSGLKATPIEVTEAAAPLLFCRKELRCDSGGAGRHRGGLGLNLEVSACPGQDFRLVSHFGHLRRGPSGRCGGQCGASAIVGLHDGKPLPDRARCLPKNFVLSVSTAGGGGYGPSKDRSREALLEDVRDGFVSSAAAMRDYGLRKKDLQAL